MGIDCKPNATDMDMPFTGYFIRESPMIKQLTEFKTLLLHQELYLTRLTIVVENNAPEHELDTYTTYICNKKR